MTPSFEQQRRLCQYLATQNPGDHFQTLGIAIEMPAKGRVQGELPYRSCSIGNPVDGTPFGGALTALLDTCCGFAAFTALDQMALCPTMDLRIDYMRGATPNLPVQAEAEAYRVSSNVVFCRGIAYQQDKQDPIAHVVANFMRLDSQVSESLSSLVSDIANGNVALRPPTAESKPQPLPEPISCEQFKHTLIDARAQRRPEQLVAAIPYAQHFGVQPLYRDGQLLFQLPPSPQLVGNPTLPAIHGGAVAGFMEMSAILHLLMTNECLRAPKIVDFSIDYIRAGRLEASFASCEVVRQGRKLVNVAIKAWQRERQQPIATARAHFLLD